MVAAPAVTGTPPRTADWRAMFAAPALPFFYVELAACNNYG